RGRKAPHTGRCIDGKAQPPRSFGRERGAPRRKPAPTRGAGACPPGDRGADARAGGEGPGARQLSLRQGRTTTRRRGNGAGGLAPAAPGVAHPLGALGRCEPSENAHRLPRGESRPPGRATRDADRRDGGALRAEAHRGGGRRGCGGDPRAARPHRGAGARALRPARARPGAGADRQAAGRAGGIARGESFPVRGGRTLGGPRPGKVMPIAPTPRAFSPSRFGVYVHFPYCLSKCPYCDFASVVVREIPQAQYARAVERELELRASQYARRPVESVYFGGGTPSLWEPPYVAAIVAAIDRLFGLAKDCEITLEANPVASEAKHFAAYRAAGVNRLSIGIQSFDEKVLAGLGRAHGPREAVDAVVAARDAGFDNLSVDLIFGGPHQDLEGAVRDAE